MKRTFPTLLLLFFFLLTSPVRTQVVSPPVRAEAVGLDVQADQLDFDVEENSVVARGNVRIRKGDQSLRADEITYNVRTEQAHARGNVVFVNDGQVWEGEELNYNFITQTGDFPDLVITYDPFRVRADEAERVSPILTRMTGVMLTTCDEVEDPEFKIQARSVEIYEEKVFVLRHPVFYLRGVPFFYLPRVSLDQERDGTNIDMVPGYDSRDGAFLLSAYNRYPKEGYRTKTHLDLRSERGVAVGQDFVWWDPEVRREHTRITGYYAQDQAPYRSDAQEESLRASGVDVEENRYRLNVFHHRQFSPRDTLRVRGSYLSDPRVVRDFFREDYRREPVPENRATYSAVGDGWTANIEASRQLNEDDFGGVNRLPEASMSFPRRQVFDGVSLLYEGDLRAGYLERTFRKFDREERDAEEYATYRLHTRQRVFYPTRHFGWLHVVPRTGFALTHYGETVDTEERTVPVTEVDEETGVITTTFETETEEVTRGADNRVLPELGFETSFKSFGLWHNEPTAMGRGLRHVVEPFSNYTLIPEPDLTPDRIRQFDSVDRMGEAHNVRFGVRNKFQTRRGRPGGRHQIHDLINVSVSTVYDLRDDVDQNLGNILVDTELRLVDWMRLRFDSQYDPHEGDIETFNTELQLEHPENFSTLHLDHRYRADRNNTMQLRYDLNPRGRVGLEGYTRYEFEEDGMEEQELLLRYETDCVGYGLGVRWTAGDRHADGTRDEDDYRVWVQFWLTAFPRGVLDLGGR